MSIQDKKPAIDGGISENADSVMLSIIIKTIITVVIVGGAFYFLKF